MIGGPRGEGWKWAQASGLSVGLHGAVLAWLIWQPGFDFLTHEPAPPLPPIEIAAFTPTPPADTPPIETGTPSPPDDGETLTPDPGDGGIDSGLQNEPLSSVIDDTVITSSALPELLPETHNAPGGPAPGSAPSLQQNTESPPPDPRMIELIARIRARLTEPCMLALPMMRGDDGLQLNVVSDSDHNITALMDSLTAGLETEITRGAVLVDPRQCPAIAFVRRDQHYPVYALGIQLESQQIARGASLRGQITNAGGYYQSLLLIDENGVVHDMRRFLLSSARSTRFDFAVARFREARDTHQMLVALATPGRPQTLLTHAGEQAEPFFDALFAELGQNVLIGVSSFYVQ
ncbi:MAG: hypothetical protein Q4G26_05050 [Paracoccus sp. (in: a-proteobacteria)]|nr:hypothetical protein [Paracoccus sp. (in: a-proteobacteria)]